MELASSFIVLLLLTGGSASGLEELEEDVAFNETDEEMSGGSASGFQEIEEDPAFDETDEEMSGGNQLPPPVPEKPFFIVLPVVPSMDSSQETVWPSVNQIMAQVERAMKDVYRRGSNRVGGQTKPDDGSASGLQEIEEDPAFYETDEDSYLSGGSALGFQEIEEDPAFDETDEEMSGGNQLPPPVPEKPFFIVLSDGSASGLQEIEEDPAFYETDEDYFLSGGGASWSQALERDSVFKERQEITAPLPYHVLSDIMMMSAVKEDMRESDPPEENAKMMIDVGMRLERIEVSPEDLPISYVNCSYQDVLDHLHLSKNNDRFRMSRPVKNHTTATEVKLVMAISAILDVRETDQTFIAYIWIHMVWKNEFIHWNPRRFCQIEHVLVPTDVLWKPDIVIEEMIEKDKAPPSEFLKIRSTGDVEYRNDLVVLSTCKMQVYKFPFDIQSCNISFKSLMHSDEELYFLFSSNTTTLTELSRKVMQTQYEWLFIKMTVTSKTDSISIDSNQTSVIHTIYMKRRSLLYIANFLIPILFFLCLDLSSFLISDSGGEKLSFKVTVLLAVTVMQLILNEILPCSSEKIPLIAVYCIGIFTLMMLSLLETILVMHLVEKDAASAQDDNTNRDHTLMKHKLSKSSIHSRFKEIYGNCAAVSYVRADQTPSVVKEDSRSQLTEVSLALGKVSDELEQIEKSVTALSEGKEEKKQGDWTRVVKKINKVFMIFYLTAVTVFLVVIFTLWCLPDEEE